MRRRTEATDVLHLHDRAGLEALDQADRYLEAAGDEEPVWPWVFPFDAPKDAAQRAVAAARLRLPKLAAEAFAQAAGWGVELHSYPHGPLEVLDAAC